MLSAARLLFAQGVGGGGGGTGASAGAPTTPTQAPGPEPRAIKSPKTARRQLLGGPQFPSGAKVSASALAVLGRATGLGSGRDGGEEGGQSTPVPFGEPRHWPAWNLGKYALALSHLQAAGTPRPGSGAGGAGGAGGRGDVGGGVGSGGDSVASTQPGLSPMMDPSVNGEVLKVLASGLRAPGVGTARQCGHLAFAARLATELQESRANQVSGSVACGTLRENPVF